MNINDLTPQALRKAANIKEKISELQKELGKLLGTNGASTPAVSHTPKNVRRKKRGMSAAGRAAVSAAAKARWAKIKGTTSPTKLVGKRKRKLSAAGRAALVAAARARWAKAKKAGKTSL